MKVETRYVAPLLGLSCLTASFFLARRFRPLRPRTALVLRIAVALPLVASGSLHLLRPRMFLALLPPPFPRESWLIVLTGVPELLGAAGLFFPRFRRSAALCLSVFMVAIFPANVYVAGRRIDGLPMPGIPARTAMQAVYIALILLAGWGRPRFRLPKTGEASGDLTNRS